MVQITMQDLAKSLKISHKHLFRVKTASKIRNSEIFTIEDLENMSSFLKEKHTYKADCLINKIDNILIIASRLKL